ncbi:MAG: DUF3000 domain-containing protein [Actinomycetota bacterium]|nr:DUF3000 domain-containing protein [Actinomycetota bacterium]
MGAGRELDPPPAQFRAAVEQLRSVRLRPEIELTEVPAPQRIAPFATALGADVVVGDRDIGTGRLVLLHDPAGNDSWEGTFRCVTFVRAEVDPEMVRDPMLAAVAWSWLTDAWQGHRLGVTAPSGTVTVVLSEGFGNIAGDGLTAQVEVRASWTPSEDGRDAAPVHELPGHVEAWAEVLGAASGLVPVTSGVVALPRRHGARG